MADIVVKKSKIEGNGVFAARDFKKGEIILRLDTGHVISEIELATLPENEKRYVERCNGKYILVQPPERYVNHSCDPNTKVESFCDIAKRE
ncbi:MAG: SET domain-containing protein [archaeon]|nr:SET domain-containing protein [Candidatus Micrarchaeota archaeon]MBU1166167.1 SET domain-containing protein [Candidatus Micrarchaeota archaeon]MBU1886565.1 SET domain-containing protein [Candidatus Micrarchaeota archaeon]